VYGFGKNISSWLAAQAFYRETAAKLARSANIPRDLEKLDYNAKKEARAHDKEAEPLFRAVVEMLKMESGMGADQRSPKGNQWKIVHPAEREPEPREHERSAFNARIQPYGRHKSP
jgi:hypothetical protein